MQAIEWTRGENEDFRVTLVPAPEVRYTKEVRTKIRGFVRRCNVAMRSSVSASQATLQELGAGEPVSRPDAPTRVLLAVIAE